MLGDAHGHSGYIEAHRFLFCKLGISFFRLYPGFASCGANVAMLESFTVGKLLGCLYFGCERADDC